MEIEKEFELLSEYLKVYVQLLPECVGFGGYKINKPQLPTFNYFKETYHDPKYSLVIPHYKETKILIGNTIAKVHTQGLGTKNGFAYRHYNMWMGCKYFTGDNIEGYYTLISKHLFCN